jgi:hypothetical protein
VAPLTPRGGRTRSDDAPSATRAEYPPSGGSDSQVRRLVCPRRERARGNHGAFESTQFRSANDPASRPHNAFSGDPVVDSGPVHRLTLRALACRDPSPGDVDAPPRPQRPLTAVVTVPRSEDRVRNCRGSTRAAGRRHPSADHVTWNGCRRLSAPSEMPAQSGVACANAGVRINDHPSTTSWGRTADLQSLSHGVGGEMRAGVSRTEGASRSPRPLGSGDILTARLSLVRLRH